MKALQIVARNCGMTYIKRGFALVGDPHKKAAAFAAAEILADPYADDQIEFLSDMHAEPQVLNSIEELKAAIRSTY